MDQAYLFSQILIGTSDAAFVQATRSVLQSAGYVVRWVQRGADILRVCTSVPPDLILLDVTLQDGNGYDVVREIKAKAGGGLIPVIMVVDLDARFDAAAAALDAGADEFLRKPLSNPEMLLRVRAMLRLKRTTDALSELNVTLEQKVVERTQALERAQVALRQTEKLSALGRLAATIVHDVNNPLSSILASLYLIKRTLPLGSDAFEDLSVIERQVDLISKLVNQLRIFSKPPQQERRPVALPSVLDEVLLLTRHDLERRKITVTSEYDPSSPLVLAAKDQMIEVFMNLVVNARDAMPQGGQLRLAVRPEDHGVEASVADTGVGIPPDVRDRLFEPFFTTKGEDGTGLGLAICYRVVQEHEGRISVASEPGRGTTFAVRLPAYG